jgi:hypothetical protein
VEVPPGTRANPFCTRPHGLFLKDNFFQNCPLLDSNPLPSPPRLIPQTESESIETVLSLTLKDGSNLSYPKNSLSDPGHLAKMPEILSWGQLWFGLGATTEHDHVSEHGSSPVHDHGGFPESETRARLFAFFRLSALIIHPCLAALPSSLGDGADGRPRKARNLLKIVLVKNRPNRIESVNFTSLSLQFVT